jgi:hypothetical protein
LWRLSATGNWRANSETDLIVGFFVLARMKGGDIEEAYLIFIVEVRVVYQQYS